MADLSKVWFGMVTNDSDDSGTDSPIVLIFNVQGGRFDVLHRTFPDTAQEDQEQGKANLYEITEDDFEPQAFVGATVDPQDLNASSIRIGIRGADMWRPKSIFIWGEQDPSLVVKLLDGLGRFAPRVRVHRIAGAGHWVQNEAADEVSRVLAEFLAEGSGKRASGE